MTHRRSLGTACAWTAGPLLIEVDGHQFPEVIAAVKDAVTGIGAQ
jgi:hypothetical protein